MFLKCESFILKLSQNFENRETFSRPVLIIVPSIVDKVCSTKPNTAMTKTKEILSGLPKHLPTKIICEVFNLNPATFKVLLHRARRLGIEMPARKRLARRYYYDVDAFANWIWENADKLRGQFGKGE